jgi:3-methylfumaryl-CoA hydratase
MTEAVNIEALRRHIGTKIVEEDLATQAPLRGIVVTFDRDDRVPEKGEPIQPGWHLTYFPAASRKAILGEDGLPTSGGVVPEMPFPRRMYAGTGLTFHEPICVGDELKRETELTDVSLREGSTGVLIFVTQTRRIFTPRGLALVEESYTVFRDAVKPGEQSGVPKRNAPPEGLPWQRTITTDPVSLFRYSALTFNPHRIHYDRTYAMGVEGYPGLVVHGPYSQQCMLDLLRDKNPDKTIRSFKQRARAPLFDTEPFSVVGRSTDDGAGAAVWAVTPAGTIAMQADVEFA